MVSKEPLSTGEEYRFLVSSIGSLLDEARRKTFYQINQTLVQTYWKIGQRIVEFEQKGKEKARYCE